MARSRTQDADRKRAARAAAKVNDDQNPNLVTWRGIRDDEQALASDRIRAAVEITKYEVEQERTTPSEHGGLVALKNVLDTLPPGDRMPYLDGLLTQEGDTVVISQ